jgi:hypothetical protein
MNFVHTHLPFLTISAYESFLFSDSISESSSLFNRVSFWSLNAIFLTVTIDVDIDAKKRKKEKKTNENTEIDPKPPQSK